MAGRNWTRKSIEELIDFYLKHRGGTGGGLSGYCELALNEYSVVPTSLSVDNYSFNNTNYPQMIVVKYQGMTQGIIKSIGGVPLTCVDVQTPTSASAVANDYIEIRKLPGDSTNKWTGTLTYLIGKNFYSNKDLSYQSHIDYVYVVRPRTRSGVVYMNTITRYIANSNQYPILVHDQSYGGTANLRTGKHYINTGSIATKFFTAIENRLNSTSFRDDCYVIASTVELTKLEIYDSFNRAFGYSNLDNPEDVGYTTIDISGDINNL